MQSEKFEHYELLKNADGSSLELGRGTMGITYKAFDTNLRFDVALKVINAAHLNDPTAEQRFLREARAAAQLRHRNVASVFHLGRCGDSYFYAMEFIEGETVDAYVKEHGPLSAKLAIGIALQVSAALMAASKQGLVHRDIKPANLMLLREGDGELLVKVIDFGLVKSALLGSTGGALTTSGFVGTPFFASPEQLEQRSEDIRSDIYSLGVTLWFMLAGKATFVGPVATVIAQHVAKAPDFKSLPEVPDCVVALLGKMLEKNPEARFQTPLELRTELKHCLEVIVGDGPSDEAAGSMSFPEAAEENANVTDERPRPLAAGSLVDSRYQLIEDLDPIHPGRIFHAEDTTKNRRVRLTVIHCTDEAFAAIREQIARIQGAAHPNFIAALDAERTRDFAYIVSEWIDGFALVDLMRVRHELALRDTFSLIEPMAPAIDVARELGIRVQLPLRDVHIHFPEGYDVRKEPMLLRSPTIDWPAHVVKLDPLGCLDELDDLSTKAERTAVNAQKSCPLATVAQFATIAYDLLGGKPDAPGPLANLSEEANAVLRRARGEGDPFASAHDFITHFRPAALGGNPPPIALASSNDTTIGEPPVATLRALKPLGKPATPASPPRTLAGTKMAAPLAPRNLRWVIAGGAALGALLAIVTFVSSGTKSTSTSSTPIAGPTPAPTSVATTPLLPPKPGAPWKNSLGVTYLPLGKVWIAATATRVRDFDAFVQATNYDAIGGMESLQRDGLKDHGHSWKDPGFKQSPDHPVVGVSRDDAGIFCEWLTKKERAAHALAPNQSYRLPTDREWSEAVRLPPESGKSPAECSGQIKDHYPWGRTFPPPENAGNYAGTEARAGAPESWPVLSSYHDAYPRTCPVTTHGNPHGFFELGGNVWEWCHDGYGQTNPRWGVLRGGSWATSRPEEMLSSYRRAFDPSFRADDVGFRCVIETKGGAR